MNATPSSSCPLTMRPVRERPTTARTKPLRVRRVASYSGPRRWARSRRWGAKETHHKKKSPPPPPAPPPMPLLTPLFVGSAKVAPAARRGEAMRGRGAEASAFFPPRESLGCCKSKRALLLLLLPPSFAPAVVAAVLAESAPPPP